MIDIHYTPIELARSLLSFVPEEFRPKSVADFSAGEGSLLKEAVALWPDIQVHANDLNIKSAKKLASENRSWCVSCSDFLSLKSHASAKYSTLKLGVDLILLNPPFSQRGIKPLWWADFKGVKSGLALAFIVLSLRYLSDKGRLLAILPNGSLTSQRDSAGWAVLKKYYNVEVLASNNSRAFKGAVANTSIVRICRKDPEGSDVVDSFELVSSAAAVPVKRGMVQMHSLKISQEGYPLVHTKNLQNGLVDIGNSPCVESKVLVRGPAMLFPRVGNVAPGKVCFLDSNKVVAISDCVLAVEGENELQVKRMMFRVVEDWVGFKNIYCGTGAKYVTLDRAKKYLSNFSLSS